eukprot:356488-Chlamydomonas_euryale.AAC.4
MLQSVFRKNASPQPPAKQYGERGHLKSGGAGGSGPLNSSASWSAIETSAVIAERAGRCSAHDTSVARALAAYAASLERSRRTSVEPQDCKLGVGGRESRVGGGWEDRGHMLGGPAGGRDEVGVRGRTENWRWLASGQGRRGQWVGRGRRKMGHSQTQDEVTGGRKAGGRKGACDGGKGLGFRV